MHTLLADIKMNEYVGIKRSWLRMTSLDCICTSRMDAVRSTGLAYACMWRTFADLDGRQDNTWQQAMEQLQESAAAHL